MGFKLGSERREIRMPHERSYKNMPKKGQIIPKNDLAPGIVAEANNDGSIFVNSKVRPGSPKFNRAIRHEQQHIRDMASGRAEYGDEWVMWEDKIYFRRDIDGVKVIDGPAGRLPEGHPDHPWEKSAIKAEGGQPTVSTSFKDVAPKELDDFKQYEASPNKFLKKLAKSVMNPVAGMVGALAGKSPVGQAVKAIKGGEETNADGEAIEAQDGAEGLGGSSNPCKECKKKKMKKGGLGGLELFGAGMNFDKIKEAHREGKPPGFDPFDIMGGGLFSDRRFC